VKVAVVIVTFSTLLRSQLEASERGGFSAKKIVFQWWRARHETSIEFDGRKPAFTGLQGRQ
jgi:hypothetical protein